MAKSPILGIEQVAENQHSKHITINDAFNALEAASNAPVAVDMTAANVTMTEDVFTSGFVFNASGHTVSRTLTLPATVNSVASKRTIIVTNGGTADLLVKAGAGSAVTLPAGTKAMVTVVSTVVTIIFQVGGTGATGDEVVLGIFVPEQPDAAVEVLRHPIVRPIQFPANFSGSRGTVRVNPTSTATFGVFLDGGSVGSIEISTSGVFTFSTSGGLAIDFAAGEVLTITAPNPQDGTLEDIGITLFGTKT